MAQYFQGFALGPKSVKTYHIDINDDLDFNDHRIKNLGKPQYNKDGARLSDTKGTGEWDVIYETTLNNDVSYIDITGLDINNHKEYYLNITTKDTEANNKIFLYVENNFNNNSYRNTGLYSLNNTLVVFNELGPTIIYGLSQAPHSAFAKVIITKDPLNYPRYSTLLQKENLYFYMFGTDLPTATTNITKLRIKATTTLKAGTYILLCKPK
jgi:hypothetical protein